jgi:hypothetical protein
MEDGRWETEDGRRKMEDGRWKTEDGRQDAISFPRSFGAINLLQRWKAEGPGTSKLTSDFGLLTSDPH